MCDKSIKKLVGINSRYKGLLLIKFKNNISSNKWIETKFIKRKNIFKKGNIMEDFFHFKISLINSNVPFLNFKFCPRMITYLQFREFKASVSTLIYFPIILLTSLKQK